MTAEEKIQAILVAASGVTSLVPAARIKPPGDWQGLERPYIVHHPVSGEPTKRHGGTAGIIWRFYQVTVYGATHSEARVAADAVVTALDGYEDADAEIQLVSPPVSYGYITDLKVAPVVINFQVAGSLT